MVLTSTLTNGDVRVVEAVAERQECHRDRERRQRSDRNPRDPGLPAVHEHLF
jgi:hypothetical protein